MTREPPVKKKLYWCDTCNLPVIARSCRCGSPLREILLEQPYDIRPALAHDRAILEGLLTERFGTGGLPKVVLLNKSGGLDRTDTVYIHGHRFGLLTFDPVRRVHEMDLTQEAVSYLFNKATRGFVDITRAVEQSGLIEKRIGGKKVEVHTDITNGPVIVRFRDKYGSGFLKEGVVRIRSIGRLVPVLRPDPSWDDVIAINAVHLKNLERHAVRFIRQHMHDRPVCNISFSGGKDSTVTLYLARKAGVKTAYFVDTGLEFPETREFVRQSGVDVVITAPDFWPAVERIGPPHKDERWCCKYIKLYPVRQWLKPQGRCVTVQGNRWYESFARASLSGTAENAFNPDQLNLSPIRNWRALEVWLYLWWKKIPCNPLYEMGLERIGCYLCPAKLEFEFELLKETHPELERRWFSFLTCWGEKNGFSPEFIRYGFWRWRSLPPKMLELARECGVRITGDAIKK
jgi:3'-phosphoadenosine 5'-phosphosulfate sulfotransferase (PAPS reductase)/FAD synthetase/predicted RNA-binding protein with PUA domain